MSTDASAWYPVIRVFSDDAGITHFEDGEVALYPSGPIGALSHPIAGATARFRVTGDDYDFDWHPTPARQFILLMSGAIDLEVGDGEVRTIRAGETLFLQDTEPPGHRTRNAGETPRWSVFIQTDAAVEYRPRTE